MCESRETFPPERMISSLILAEQRYSKNKRKWQYSVTCSLFGFHASFVCFFGRGFFCVTKPSTAPAANARHYLTKVDLYRGNS